jgi:hypothetical protein
MTLSWSSCSFPGFKLNDPAQSLPQQVVHGGHMNQRRIQPGFEVVPVQLRDGAPGRLQIKLPGQTELRVQPPVVFHDRSSSSAFPV